MTTAFDKKEIVDQMLTAALDLAARGWPVFPCKTRGQNAKRPFTQHGFKDASTDPGTIRNWWSRWPGAAIGVPTGPSIGCFVLDVDLPQGPDSIKTLEAQHAPLPATAMQRTGSGGFQCFFRWPQGVEIRNSTGKLGPGLDVRGLGGYVLVPPSLHPSGNCYEWITNGTRPADAPGWLVDLITKSAPEPKQEPTAKTRPATSKGTTAYGRKALADEAEKVATATPTTRNTTLNTAACKIGHLVAGNEIEEADAWNALLDAAQRCALSEGEARKTIRSGLEAGMKDPRSAPPRRDQAGPAQEQSNTSSEKNHSSISSDTKVEFFNAADLEHEVIPPLTWIVPGMLPVGLAWLVGAMKAGKSHFVLDMLVSIATGSMFLDAECEKAEALYLDLEGSKRRMQQRIREHKATFPKGMHYALDFPRLDRGFDKALDTFLVAHPACRIVAVDVFARVNAMMPKGVDAYQWQYDLLNNLKRLAERHNICLLLLHHANKGTFTDILNSVHGSVANTAAADTILVLRRNRGATEGKLHIHGRDVMERTLVMEAGENFTWKFVGDEAEVGISRERQEILDYLAACPGDVFSPAELARELDKKPGNIRKLLHSMARDGQVMKKKIGRNGYRYTSF
jgi:hypothetical protein